MTNEQVKNDKGRRRIYTDVKVVDETNVIEVVKKCIEDHEYNVNHMKFLYDFEKGNQPLSRKKEIRKEIDIEDIINLANYIVDFKVSYNWGNPITYIKRKESTVENEDEITAINTQLDLEGFSYKITETMRDMEIVALGYAFIDIKRNRTNEESAFDLAHISPLYAFKIYKNDIFETPIADVIFRTLYDGTCIYSVYTKEKYFLIKNLHQIINDQEEDKGWFFDPEDSKGERNVLGELPLIEFRRNDEMMGCFEREIESMKTVNTMSSDFANSVSQEVQSIMWANDVEFPKDDNNNVITPKSNQWLNTQTSPDGRIPKIESIGNKIDYVGTLNKITYSVNSILQRCFVPLQQEMNGGSSGNAMSMSSGWTQAEAYAQREEKQVRKSFIDLLKLILIACNKVNYLVDDKSIDFKKITIRDIEPRVVRNKTYDLTNKVNSICALLGKGFALTDALSMCDAPGDIAQIIENSGEGVRKLQNLDNTEEETHMQDLSDQTDRSPIIDGIKTLQNNV